MKILYLSSIFFLNIVISLGIGYRYRLNNLEEKTEKKIIVVFPGVGEDMIHKRQELNVKYQKKINKNKRKPLIIISNLPVKPYR